jgi:hypothetical protein
MFSYTDVEDSLPDMLTEVDLKFTDLQLHRLESDPFNELDGFDSTRGLPLGQFMHSDPFHLLVGFHDKAKSTVDKDHMCFSYESYGYQQSGTFAATDPFFLPQIDNGCRQNIKASTSFDFSAPLADCEGFQEHHVPPSPPSSEHFSFDTYTLFVEGCSPQQVGNSLVAFFRSQVVASVTKVKLEKYSIRAEVFVEGASCAIKVRVYSVNGKYAVEVQRRAGDAFILQSTHRLLKAFLEVHCGGVSSQEDTPAPLVLSAPPGHEINQDFSQVQGAEIIAPLMMATFVGLQAEVASTLATMAKGGRTSIAPLLADPERVASALKDLLSSGCMSAVYPAARCVSELAAVGEADLILAHHGLLQMLALQAVAELRTAHGLVGTGLAQAVADAVQSCAGSLETAVARDLQQVLDDAMQDERLKKNVVARKYMEQAWVETKPLA